MSGPSWSVCFPPECLLRQLRRPGCGSTIAGARSPFDLSVLGPAWKVAAEPFVPATERPSDCPEYDRLKADLRSWATTQRTYRINGVTIAEVNARAPDAATAASFLDRQSKFMLGCHIVRYPGGGVTRIEPASSRTNQTGYPVQHDALDEQSTLYTVKGPWIIEVTVFEASAAPPQLEIDVSRTLLDQALA